MIRTTAGALAALILAGVAAAQDRAPVGEAVAMRDFFTGTLEIDVPAGPWSAKRYLAPDHTYRETGSDGVVRDGKVCTTAQRPVESEDRTATYCNAILDKHAGEVWRAADPVTGNTVLFKLTAGR